MTEETNQTQSSSAQGTSPLIQVDPHTNMVTMGSLQQSLKARADAKRSAVARLADRLTALFGSMPFLIVNVVWFAIWIPVNLGWVPGVSPFDPFPFGLLTMIVSLEAIVLAIIVLISQNRAAALAELREEVTLTVGEITERELTKVLALTTRILEAQGIDLSQDDELRNMLLNTNTEEIVEEMEEEIGGHAKKPHPAASNAEVKKE